MRIVVQRSPLAGAQYYALAELWPLLKVGDTLELVREAGNAHDPHAVRIEWRGRKLGYVPRAENRAVAAALDGGEALAARIASQQKHRSPWRRMQFDILVEM